MLNKVILIGRITNNLQLRVSKNGKEFLYFTLAVNNSFNNQTDFIPCIAWEKTAKAMSNNIAKGSLIAVDGRLQVRQVREEGKEFAQSLVDVYALNVKFLESKTRRDVANNSSLINEYSQPDASNLVVDNVNPNDSIAESFDIESMNFNFTESSSNSDFENLNNEQKTSLIPDNDDGIAWEGE